MADNIESDRFAEIAKGNAPGKTLINKFGFNAAVGSSFEPVWVQSTAFTRPTSSVNYQISSSNNGDTQDIVIGYLDANGELAEKTVALTGQTPFDLGLMTYAYRAFNDDTTALLGDVYIYEETAAPSGVPADITKIRAKIVIGDEQTFQTMMRVPSNMTGILHWWNSDVGKNDDSVVRIRTAMPGKVLRTRDEVSLFEDGSGNRLLEIPLEADEDIIVEARSIAGGIRTHGKFILELTKI